ncbi:hypothetical protein D3C80_1579700 [compost metagenome]
MDALKRGCHAQNRIAMLAKKGCTFDDQEGTQSFAAVQHAMTHGSEQSLGASHFAGAQTKIQKPDQHCLDFEGAQVQGLSKIDRHVFHV